MELYPGPLAINEGGVVGKGCFGWKDDGDIEGGILSTTVTVGDLQ